MNFPEIYCKLYFWSKKLIRACSVSMVTDLLKVLFGSFFFIHIFAVYLIVFVLYAHIINQEDIISSYHTELIIN